MISKKRPRRQQHARCYKDDVHFRVSMEATKGLEEFRKAVLNNTPTFEVWIPMEMYMETIDVLTSMMKLFGCSLECENGLIPELNPFCRLVTFRRKVEE